MMPPKLADIWPDMIEEDFAQELATVVRSLLARIKERGFDPEEIAEEEQMGAVLGELMYQRLQEKKKRGMN